jgi:hypothetical protein
MKYILLLILGALLAATSTVAGGESAARAPRQIPGKIDTEFRPEAGVEYTLGGASLYRPARGSDPGPAERDTSIAWSFANEFVYRTALAKQYVVPAESAGRRKDGSYEVGFTSKDRKSRFGRRG